MKLVGYTDRLSVRPGEAVDVKISTELPSYRTELVQLTKGGVPGRTHDSVEESVPGVAVGEHPGRVQCARAGSYVHGSLTEPAVASGFSAAAWIWPTTPGLARVQAVLAASCDETATKLTIALTEDGLALLADDRVLVASPSRPAEREWCFVAASYDPRTGAAYLTHRVVDGVFAEARATVSQPPAVADVREVWVAASPDGELYNGKVARPVLLTRPIGPEEAARLAVAGSVDVPLPIAVAWDFSRDQHSRQVPDLGPHGVVGECVNMPTRAVTGPHWTGAELDFRQAPDEFDAIHFHDDDLEDAGWATDVSVQLPADLRSGVYAIVAGDGEQVDRIPFVVREPVGAAGASVLVVLPTWTYLAYANWRTYVENREQRKELYGEDRIPDAVDDFLVAHPDLGKSLYDKHGDGSGVAYSSRLRPILNMRPNYYTPTTKGLRHFAADLYVIDWLESLGVSYAVATDDDLHAEGVDLLRRHQVVVTGTHPEYVSAAMLDALDAYTASGGRLMYLGGNGFYWVTAQHPEAPHVVEIRRGNAGVRVWDSAPGEVHLSSTGEHGGLWRYRGRAPQRLAGVGFTAQGFDFASPYRRSAASYDPAVSWVFDGVDAEVFGDVGLGLGGAAGDEIDRADPSLGTPRDAWVLASSFGHSAKIVLSPDEAGRELSGAAADGGGDPKVRSDVVLFSRPGGGAVFATGSIAWMSAVAYAGGDNDTARITSNVLHAFLGNGAVLPRPRAS